jgi:hypothetical protein
MEAGERADSAEQIRDSRNEARALAARSRPLPDNREAR